MPHPASGGDERLRARLERSLSGSHRIERELGGGGMSRVFLAEEIALGRRVVVKVLAPELAQEVSAERFTREIRLSARLQHPNIVPVLTAGIADAVPYYTMPFVEGESLRARMSGLAPGERMPVAQSIPLLRDIARALNYAHSMGVVHRDIKPENVLLGYDAALVADFGVAKALAAARTHAAAAGIATLTQDGMALGTPAYMSPEQAAGDPSVDHRADLYAWGVLAYELLAGAHPFAGRTSIQALVTAHLVEQPRALAGLAPEVPPAIAALVTRCLAKPPADRPANAGELVEVLSGGTAGTAAVVRQRVRRLLPLAAGVAIVAAGGVGIRYLTRDPPPATRDGTAPRRYAGSPGYDAYLRGRVRVGSENREANDGAIEALRQAVAADPALAPAHAELARAYSIKAFYFAADSARKPLLEDAGVAVEKALALDPNLAEAHLARGQLLWTPGQRFPHEQAVAAFRRALVLDSTLDEAHHQIGLVLLHVGLLDAAQREVDQALALNPGNTLARFRLGVIAMYRGEYQRAYAVFNSTPLERNPSLWGFQTATALFRLGRVAEAEAMLEKFLRDNPRDEGGVGHSVEAMMRAAAGDRPGAEAAISRALALGRNFGHFHHTAFNIASAYALMDNRTEAIRWLKDAADNGFPCYPLFASDHQLDGLRSDPRFIEFMQGLQRDWEQRKQVM